MNKETKLLHTMINSNTLYRNGEGVERDERKADHFDELAALGGHAPARHNLGNSERRVGNWNRALKHFVIAAGGGDGESVKAVQQ